MKGLNLSGFKKLKEDKKTVTMGHPSGHSITILKTQVSPIQKKQLERLPLHLADGTPDDPVEASEDSAEPSRAPASVAAPIEAQSDQPAAQSGGNPFLPSLSDIKNAAGAAVNGLASISLPKTQSQASPDANPYKLASASDIPDAGAPVQDPNAQSDQGPPVVPQNVPFTANSTYNLGAKAIREQQSVAGQLAQKQADIEQQDIDARKEFIDQGKQNYQNFLQHQQRAIQDYQENKINPNHFQENQTVPQKVSTAIGLLLGGFSAGFSHSGVNPAQEWLNAQINRDVEAQKSRLDQQKTLLGANQELYKDGVLAENATRAQVADFYGAQIKKAADDLGTPAAKANADQALAKLQEISGPAIQQNALRATVLQQMQRNGGQGLDPITLSHAGFLSPEEAQKEQASIDTQKGAIKGINGLYQQANQEQTTGNLLNPQSYKRINQINASIRDLVLSTDTAHRVSPDVLSKFVEPFLISTTDDAQTRAQKQNGLLNKVQQLNAGTAPLTAKYAPAALPQYGTVTGPQRPQYKVGDMVYIKGKPAQIVNAKGDYKLVGAPQSGGPASNVARGN